MSTSAASSPLLFHSMNRTNQKLVLVTDKEGNPTYNFEQPRLRWTHTTSDYRGHVVYEGKVPYSKFLTYQSKNKNVSSLLGPYKQGDAEIDLTEFESEEIEAAGQVARHRKQQQREEDDDQDGGEDNEYEYVEEDDYDEQQ